MDSVWEMELKRLTGELSDSHDLELDERESKLKAVKALQSHEAELIKKIAETKEQHLKLDADALDEIAQIKKRLEREKNQYVRFQHLTEKFNKLTEWNHQLQHQIQRHADYLDSLEQTAKMTVFQTAERLTDHLDNIIYIRNKVFQKDSDKWEEVKQLKRTCALLKKQQRFQQLQNNTKLLQLQTELQRASSEVQIWEKRWDHFQKTATEQQIEVAQIKMAVLNLFEMIGDKEHVAMDDTDTQLERVKLFFQDHVDILKQLQSKHFHRRHLKN